jgi:hypothetical protein
MTGDPPHAESERSRLQSALTRLVHSPTRPEWALGRGHGFVESSTAPVVGDPRSPHGVLRRAIHGGSPPLTRTYSRHRMPLRRPTQATQNGMDASACAGDTPAQTPERSVRAGAARRSDQLAAPPGLTRREVPPIEAAPVWPVESASALPTGQSALPGTVSDPAIGGKLKRPGIGDCSVP